MWKILGTVTGLIARIVLACCLIAPVFCSAEAAPIAEVAPRSPGVDRGELLLGELNCIQCHQARPRVAARLASPSGPLLGSEGLVLSPVWLREWLEDPQRLKPGTTMPDLLHGLAPAERAEAADSLTHYLTSLQPRVELPSIGADPTRLAQGKDLFHGIGCVMCHVPEERPGEMPVDVFEKARAHSVPLGDLAKKYPASELIRFLKDPLKHRPGGRMPDFQLNDAEATALATYLLRDQVPELTDGNRPLQTVAGLRWEYFEAHFGGTADMDSLKPRATGETADLSLSMRQRDEQFGVRFTGVIEVPRDGEYTFWLNSDDGSILDIQGRRIVDNDGDHGPVTKRGRIRLTAGPHPLEVRFYQNGGGYEFQAFWSGPGIERQPIPATVLKRFGQPMEPIGWQPLLVDPQKVAQGRNWYAKLQCATCHRLTDPEGVGFSSSPAPSLAALRGRAEEGCLAANPGARSPKYALSQEQRDVLRRAVIQEPNLAQPSTPELSADRTFSRLNCYACHDRNGLGGAEQSGRSGWMQVLGEADLGEEGRIPPSLTGVGAKLRTEWLMQVLTGGEKVRPYMRTRMPQFGVAQVGALPGHLAVVDAPVAPIHEPDWDVRDSKFGHLLVGQDGLSCISCHTFSTFGSAGIPALGLDQMYARLRWDWFRRYLEKPGVLRPGTRMPSFWPDGQAANSEILDGDTDAQIGAIWAWLRDGIRADVPAGLIRARMEIVPSENPVIYRNFIEGAGPRAIGVGYPERAHLAWDANQMRPALIWQGSFIDQSRHSTDRGVGYEPPLGSRVVTFPPGPSVVTLVDSDAPWPELGDRPAGYRFLGYVMDPNRRPVFRYRVGELEVTDAFEPRVISVDVTFIRTLTISGSATQPVWIRVAKGELKEEADGVYLWDNQVRIRVLGETVRKVGDELRVPVQPEAGGKRVQVEMTW